MEDQKSENGGAAYFIEMAERLARSYASMGADPEGPHSAYYSRYAKDFESLAQYLRTAASGTSDKKGRGRGLLALTAEDLEGLPPELLAEVSVSEADKLYFSIRDVVESNGGRASLDQIIIGVYRRTGQILKRSRATNVVYAMKVKGLLFPVKGVKAAYSIDPADAEPEEPRNLEE